MFSSTFSSIGKWCCLKRKKKENKHDNNLTMEIKVADEQSGDLNTTIIECVNDTKWNTPRRTKPIKGQSGDTFKLPPKCTATIDIHLKEYYA